jgi:hypothetical protein
MLKPMIYGRETCQRGVRFKFENIRSLGFRDIRDELTLRKLMLWGLECTRYMSHMFTLYKAL